MNKYPTGENLVARFPDMLCPRNERGQVVSLTAINIVPNGLILVNECGSLEQIFVKYGKYVDVDETSARIYDGFFGNTFFCQKKSKENKKESSMFC